ncbi:reticulon-like protein B17 [Rutidosis leptorrhynchoides]|uniref:reticulon-like protein B17 n=1 Tax=Rutidosis leptorrhynchoides TaxID=125765 RepID=UPI003A98E737
MDSPMNSPPPYTRSDPKNRTKSASRLARTSSQEPPPTLSLDLVSYSPKNTVSPKPQNPLSLHDLLLLSPSPAKKSRTRDIGEEISDLYGSRRRCKNRFTNLGSPRNSRRSRRRIEQEIKEDKDLICDDELVAAANNVKAKKRRHSSRSKKEKSISSHSVPSPKGNDGDDEYGYNFDRIGLLVNDLIMWNDVAKSTLWFGFGSLCFISSCFTKGISFSMLSLISHIGLLCLGVSFFSNIIAQRNGIESKREFRLKEDDILRAARVVLPALNFALSKARDLFSGEPSTTLKVAPLLLLGSQYGQIVTFKRLCALGFFIGFTGPKLYSLYSIQICKKGECLKERILETWGGCSHKKIVAASVVTAFWNLTSIKTRIFAAFICLVIFRWYRQELPWEVELEKESQQQQKTLTVVENVKA